MWLENLSPDRGKSLGEYGALFGAQAPSIVRSYPTLHVEPSPTPLHRLGGLAKYLELGSIFAKDESHRLGLGNFKALGGPYAVARYLQRCAENELARRVAPIELLQPQMHGIFAAKTVACATDGNHGLSVAAAARHFGCRSVVYLHNHVSLKRIQAIAATGAEIVFIDGTYDDSVDECASAAAREGWHLIADTSWPGSEHVAGEVMQGYTVMMDECCSSLHAADEKLTHLFIQGGCGGVAAAISAHLRLRNGGADPTKVIVVEPARANCLLQSAHRGKLTRIEAGEPTKMAMLECYQPSSLAWNILKRTADVFMDVTDDEIPDAVRALASPNAGDPVILAGDSGSASFAGLLSACADSELRAHLDIDETSRILVFITEGAGFSSP